jgi:hypothetical protein
LIREHDTGACPLLRRDLRRVPLLLLFITAGPIKMLCTVCCGRQPLETTLGVAPALKGGKKEGGTNSQK